MDIFDALEMIGGLCLFLFGMNIMGQALERRAGSRLRTTPVSYTHLDVYKRQQSDSVR